MTFLELAEKILKENNQPLSTSDIWNYALQKGYEKQLSSLGKTPWATLGAQIYVNAKDNPKSIFEKTDTRPKKFFLKSASGKINLSEQSLNKEEIVVRKSKFDYLEKDLHAYLSYYAYTFLNCVTKTINHSHSTKKEFGEWVHPDIVGCYFPLEDWKNEVYELSSAIGNISIKLLSFELKREVTFSNLRECFFQTVSNSSWANESYLVCAELSNDIDFRSELARLSTSFGIGVIKLNLEDPNSTEVIFPAKFRDSLDWETINKLTMNADFKEFITTVKIDITSKRIHKKEYDAVLDEAALRKY